MPPPPTLTPPPSYSFLLYRLLNLIHVCSLTVGAGVGGLWGGQYLFWRKERSDRIKEWLQMEFPDLSTDWFGPSSPRTDPWQFPGPTWSHVPDTPLIPTRGQGQRVVGILVVVQWTTSFHLSMWNSRTILFIWETTENGSKKPIVGFRRFGDIL